MQGFFDWLGSWHVGDLAGIAGLLVSIAGFAFTIWQIRRARSVAEQVSASVQDVRKQLGRKAVAIDLNELIRELEEMKEMHRSTDVRRLLARRYSAIRRKLIEVKSGHPSWSKKQSASLQGSISEFANFEHLLDSSSSEEQVSLMELNSKVNEQIDKMVALLVVVQN